MSERAGVDGSRRTNHFAGVEFWRIRLLLDQLRAIALEEVVGRSPIKRDHITPQDHPVGDHPLKEGGDGSMTSDRPPDDRSCSLDLSGFAVIFWGDSSPLDICPKSLGTQRLEFR